MAGQRLWYMSGRANPKVETNVTNIFLKTSEKKNKYTAEGGKRTKCLALRLLLHRGFLCYARASAKKQKHKRMNGLLQPADSSSYSKSSLDQLRGCKTKRKQKQGGVIAEVSHTG